jgi:hypothetical protein
MVVALLVVERRLSHQRGVGGGRRLANRSADGLSGAVGGGGDGNSLRRSVAAAAVGDIDCLPRAGERAVLVQLDLGQGAIDERLSELELLALSAGASVEAVVQGKRAAPDPKLFAGSGKVQEIGEPCVRTAPTSSSSTTPVAGQQRNLERELQCMVIDRTR